MGGGSAEEIVIDEEKKRRSKQGTLRFIPNFLLLQAPYLKYGMCNLKKGRRRI
jgi:hypothetical protein